MSANVYVLTYSYGNILYLCEEPFNGRSIQVIADDLREKHGDKLGNDVYFVTLHGILAKLSDADYKGDMNVMLYFGTEDNFIEGRRKVYEFLGTGGFVNEMATSISMKKGVIIKFY
ncbi:hypothetical protein GGF41_007883 [Coemansia sp. RSA 2531]|nr:hypothetical protein GGF41_007883 [Coemansia sp. RSA 2531]